MNKVSIITCTYNSERYLKQTIQSVISQSYKNFEHIFIDANSTDDTLKIIEDYKKKYPKQVHLYKQKPCGISNAMNFGIENANGDIICHLHSDDKFFDKNTLKTVIQELNDNKAKWCYGNIEIINEYDKIYNREKPPKFSYDLLKKRNFIPHPATFIKKELFVELGGFNPSLKYAMDYDLWIRLATKYTPLKIDKFLSKFRRHTGGLSTKQYLNALKEDYSIRIKLPNNYLTKTINWSTLQLNIIKYQLAKLFGRV